MNGVSFRAAAVWRFIALSGIVLVLPGCCSSNVAPADVVKVVTALSAAAAMAARKAKLGEGAFGHYVERRTIYLGNKNSGWMSESGYPSFTARLGAELDAVGAFIDDRVTVFGGTDPATPAHRDLDDAGKRLTSDGPSDISSRSDQLKKDRAQRIAQICYRACAIHAELWAGGDSTLSPTLQKVPLTELLDRRLTVAEFMILHDEGGLGAWTIGAKDGSWTDGQRLAMFQYPWVDVSSDFTAALATKSLDVPGLAPQWNLGNDGRIYWSDKENRPRPPAAWDWTVTDKPYLLTMSTAGGASATAIFERLIPSAAKVDAAFEDFWQRNWLYCDMMIASLHVHALRVGRHRRTGTDADFDGAAGGGVTLRPLIPKSGAPTVTQLMPNAGDWFEGVGIPHEELQVGDHLVFWNNPFVRHILHSAFGLENSFVTRITPNGRMVMLAGHGMPEMSEADFATEMAKNIQDVFDGIRDKINEHFVANPASATFTLSHGPLRFQLCSWAPYKELFSPIAGSKFTAEGAWWIRLRLDQMHDDGSPAPTMNEALLVIPRSVRVDPAFHTEMPVLAAGDHDADYQESVYLPMQVPAGVPGGWTAYLSNPSKGESVELSDLIIDGTMIPGFYANGPSSTLPVFRPKLKP
jgi:hypothetical protein